MRILLFGIQFIPPNKRHTIKLSNILVYAGPWVIVSYRICSRFATFQPTEQEAVIRVRTFQFSHLDDWWASYRKMEGAEYQDTSSDDNQAHTITDFIDQIKKLPEGKYKIVGERIVPI